MAFVPPGYYDNYRQHNHPQQQMIGSGFDDLLQFPGNPPEVHEEKVAAALVKNFEFLQRIDLVNAGLLSADEIKKNKAPVIILYISYFFHIISTLSIYSLPAYIYAFLSQFISLLIHMNEHMIRKRGRV